MGIEPIYDETMRAMTVPRSRIRRVKLQLFFLAAAFAGCNNPVYLSQRRPLETKTDPTGNGFVADTDLFVLPVRRPRSDESKKLAEEQRKLQLPMKVPWVAARDFDIEVEYSIKNLEASAVKVTLQLNGGNEFGDYVPTDFVDPTAAPEDQVPPPALLGGTPVDFEANELKTGVFREDDLQEAGLDLEAITRYPPPDAGMNAPFEVLERRSSQSRIGLEGIPAGDVTPAMVRYTFVLSATGHVVMDYSIRVRERVGGDLLAQEGNRNLYVSTDALLPAPAVPSAASTMTTTPAP
jgi:hypothetical protein